MTRRWMIRRYDHRLTTMGDAMRARFDAIEERECPDIGDCIGEVHNLMWVASCMESDSNFAFVLWVEDGDDAMPVYVMMRESDESPRLCCLMTPDVAEMLDQYDPAWKELIREEREVESWE